MTDESSPVLPSLRPLPYHLAVVSALRTNEPEVWKWISSAEARDEYADQVRGELLKETYRLDAEAHSEVHQCCAAAAQRLGIDIPITLYQRGDVTMNAALYFVPGEAHVVFSGPLLERLRGAELEAVIGHELSHYLLWELDGGVYHTADRILSAVAQDRRSSAGQLQTARLFRLYTEIFADRGGAVACNALLPAVNALVKTQTGLTEVSGAHYLKQAEEICAPGKLKAAGDSHPEIYVRARALRLWCEGDADADGWLVDALQGPPAFDQLDLLGQQQLTSLTRRVLARILQPKCLRSEIMLGHAKKFFPDFECSAAPDSELDAEVAAATGMHDFIAYLLMDFAVADPDLDNIPLAANLELAKSLGLTATFERIAQKELSMPKRQFNKLKQDAAALLAKAEQDHV